MRAIELGVSGRKREKLVSQTSQQDGYLTFKSKKGFKEGIRCSYSKYEEDWNTDLDTS